VDTSYEVYVTEQPPVPGPTLADDAFNELQKATSGSGTIMRCLVAGVDIPPEWKAYVFALRAIVNGTDTISNTLPARPAYPAGT